MSNPETDIRIKECMNGWLIYRTGEDTPLWVASNRLGDLPKVVGIITGMAKEDFDPQEIAQLLTLDKVR